MSPKTLAERDGEEMSSKWHKRQYLYVMESDHGRGLMLVFSGLDGMETIIRFKRVEKRGTSLRFFTGQGNRTNVLAGSMEADSRVISVLEDAGVEIEVK